MCARIHGSALFVKDVVISKPMKELIMRSTVRIVLAKSVRLFAKLRSLPINLAKIALDHPLPENLKATKQFPLAERGRPVLGVVKVSRHLDLRVLY